MDFFHNKQSAIWNSRAIYCLLAYFLLPKWREMLEASVSFTASGWQEAWFSDKKFHTERYNNLLASIKKLNVNLQKNVL